MPPSNNRALSSESFELVDLRRIARERDQQAHTIIHATVNGEIGLLPPPYSAVALGEGIAFAVHQEDSTASRRNEFRIQSRKLRHVRDTLALRWFFLGMLMIDYDVDAEVMQGVLARSTVGNHITSHFELYKRMVSEDALEEAGELFLAEMPEAVRALGVDHSTLCLAMMDFHGDTTRPSNSSERYHCFFDRMPLEMMIIKLRADRHEAIDSLVPSDYPELRTKLHVGLERKQMAFFDCVLGLEDYEPTPLGREVRERWAGWSVKDPMADLWREGMRRAVAQPVRLRGVAETGAETGRSEPGGRCMVM